ncbi:MAG: hypothetical protein ACK5YW_09190 [Betaproteobacteria bacterium]|nr:hypothetical protein [Rhodocyclaceae bacterium]MCE2898306.1 hypothetical protein [Betaproteobacteria bacterium]
MRLRGTVRDQVGAALRTGAALAAADLSPRGLAPAAVLLVRTLRDPLPGTVSLRRPGPAPPRWSAAVAQALDAAARQAARPATGPVPPGAESVLFNDRAELLACLARDWLDGVATGRWWWRTLFRGQDISRALSRAWAETPAFVPPAMASLARHDIAVRFARALDETVAKGLLEAVLRAHGLVPLGEAMAATEDTPPRTPAHHHRARRAAAGAAVAAPQAAQAPATLALEPPPLIASRAPEALAQPLSSTQRALLAVTLALARAPAEARTAAFAVSVTRWLRQYEAHGEPSVAAESGASAPPAPLAGARPPRAAAGPSLPARTSRGAAGGWHASPLPGPGLGAMPSGTAAREPILAAPPAAPPGHHPPGPLRARAAAGASALHESPAPAPFSRKQALPALAADITPAPRPRDEPSGEPRTVATGYGGLFCLINAAIALGLYGDFTAPLEPGIELAPWDFLARAGEHLAGPAIRRDPIWALLADLAGRAPDSEPGLSFVPPGNWRMPTAWLVPFAGRRGAWRWKVCGGRLTVHHPAGFAVLDVARDACPAEAQVRREMRPWREQFRFRLWHDADSAGQPEVHPIERWTGWVMAYLRRRLAAGLGVRHPHRAARLLLRRPARITVSAARLDVHLELASLPVEVRLAGLDRDPGWVPAAGHHVAFHYD